MVRAAEEDTGLYFATMASVSADSGVNCKSSFEVVAEAAIGDMASNCTANGCGGLSTATVTVATVATMVSAVVGRTIPVLDRRPTLWRRADSAAAAVARARGVVVLCVVSSTELKCFRNA